MEILTPKEVIKMLNEIDVFLKVEGDTLKVQSNKEIYKEITEMIEDNKANLILYMRGKYRNDDWKAEKTFYKILQFYWLELPENEKEKVKQALDRRQVAKLAMKIISELAANGWKKKTQNYLRYKTPGTHEKILGLYKYMQEG